MINTMKHIILFVLLLSLKANCELFSSMAKLEQLIETQRVVILDIHKGLWKMKRENKIVKIHLKRFELEHQEAIKDVARYLGNPFTIFRLIKRLTVDFDYIESLMQQVIDFERNKTVIYPTRVDIEGAAEGLLRLMNTYNLNITLLSNGIWVTPFRTPMSESDCYELAKAFYSTKRYIVGLRWIEEASRKFVESAMENYQDDNRISAEDIEYQRHRGYKGLENSNRDFTRWWNELSILKPNLIKEDCQLYYTWGLKPREAVNAIEDYKRVVATSNFPDLMSVNITETYFALCNGEKTNNQATLSKRLSCYYVHGPHPFLKLAPIKAERLLQTPEFTLFHDVIYDAEIKDIKDIDTPKLARCRVTSGYLSKESADRICQVGYAHANESTLVARLRTRLSHITGLSLAESEPLQASNYGIAGVFKMHFDFSTDENFIEQNGNPLATVILYLSDVEEGGATVFPALGLSIFPVKGTALFWKNLRPSGQGIRTTYHAACPVLSGSKWVAVQWINTRGQELTHPCPVNLQRQIMK